MKISIKQLRQIVRETIEEINEAKDEDLAIGDEVSVIVNNRPVKGKIVDKYSSKFVDPMAVGKHMMPRQAGRMMWSVNVSGRIIQVPADEIEVIRSVKKGQARPIWKTDMNVKKTQEATAVSGRSTMLHGGDDNEDPDEKEKDDHVLLDDTLHEADEDREADTFNDRRYEDIAKGLVFNWEDRTPEVNWRAVAKSYVRARRSVDGKVLDTEKLYKAILKFLETAGDERDQTVFTGTHLSKWS